MSRRPALALTALLIAGVGLWLMARPLTRAATTLRELIADDDAPAARATRDIPLTTTRPAASAGSSVAAPDPTGPTAICEVRAIDATARPPAGAGPNTTTSGNGPTLAPRLRDLRERFSRPPFSHLRDFRLVLERRLRLPHDQRGSLKLPGARTLRLTYRGTTMVNDRRQLRLSLTLRSFAARATYQSLRGVRVLLAPGTPLVLADSGRGRQLRLIALRCHERPLPTSQRTRPLAPPRS